MSKATYQNAGELGLDDQQSLVGDAGVLRGGIAHRPDQPLTGGQAGQDPPLDRRVDVGDQPPDVIP